MGAHGDAVGGKVKLVKLDKTVGANNRDFRIRPDEGLFDPQSGLFAIRPQPRRLGQLVRQPE